MHECLLTSKLNAYELVNINYQLTVEMLKSSVESIKCGNQDVDPRSIEVIDQLSTVDAFNTHYLKQPFMEGERHNVRIIASITDVACLFLYAFVDIVNPISAV